MKKIFILIFLLVYFLFLNLGYSQEKELPKITFIAGEVKILKKGEKDWKKAKIGMTLFKEDKIKTGEDSLVEISISNHTFIRLREFTTLEVSQLKEKLKEESSFYLWLGDIWIKTLKLLDREAKLNIRTAIAVAGIRGTTFSCSAKEDKSTQINVYKGQIKVENLPLKKEFTKKKEVYEIETPFHEVSKPYYEVTYEEWCQIVKSMEQITIYPDGRYKKKKIEEEKIKLDPWVKWNKERDSLLEKIKNLDKEIKKKEK